MYYDLKRIDYPPFISKESLLEILISIIFEDQSILFSFSSFIKRK